ncbi:MAG: SRPBCC family protein [Labilithrix sp.]|nr:SRPBCC family protein [Labilithrix sp.]MCW5831143.1 SRPBCC family protein [Labilithrix sp.]
MTTSETRTVTVTIERPWTEVYDFASIPLNFQRWASGLGGSLRKVGGEWTAQGPDGPVRVRFSERNGLGVLDHWVTPEGGGAEIYVPLRVVANGDGAEVSLTLFRGAGRSDEDFAADADWVRRDLGALKALLEA